MTKSFLFAVSFLTRLPLPASVHEVDDATVAKGPLWFPLVGGLIGLSTGLVILGLASVLPSLLAIAIALAIEARLTGAMHEDALADSADALGGGWTRERTLEIFKDSRLGTYGVLALVLGVAIRALALDAVLLMFVREPLGGQPLVFLIIVTLAGFVGRLQMLAFLKALPPISGRTSLSQNFAGAVTPRALMLLAIVPVLLALSTLYEGRVDGSLEGMRHFVGHSVGFTHILTALGLCLALHFSFCPYIRRKLGGSTGDVLGAVAFASQALVLVAFSTH